MKSRQLNRAIAEIDLSAIAHNISQIKGMIPGNCIFMAVVKANGYGHGAIEASKTAIKAGAKRLGVATVEEGRQLRSEGLSHPIHLLGSFFPEEADEIVALGLIPAVFTENGIDAIEGASRRVGKVTPVHLKVDTGMNRVGARGADAVRLLKKALSLKNIEVEGVMTHFACADLPDRPTTAAQLELFEAFLGELDSLGIELPITHAANSAAALLFPESRYDMVRIGIAMYGLSPVGRTGEPDFLRPALSLKTSVAYVKRIDAGEGVSYSHTFRAEKPTSIATLPIGYGDGYSRRLSNVSDVLIGGRRYRTVGNICMDQLMVDLGDDVVEIGEEAVLIGSQGEERISVEELAAQIGTINYEVVCGISGRVERQYVRD